MSYGSLESSEYLGSPVELYRITSGNQIWYYTSGDVTISHQGHDYIPVPISRANVSQSQELNKITLQVTVPRSLPISGMLLTSPPTLVTYLTIFRKHREDSQVITYWVGRILNGECTGATVTLHCEPITTAVKRLGLRRNYQRQCPHSLFDNLCTVNKDAVATYLTVTGKSGLTVHHNSSVQPGYFAGGMMRWDAAIGPQWRFIMSNTSTTVDINLPVMPDGDEYGRDLPVGRGIVLYPGCAHTLTDCKNKFNNISNYGGFPFIPITNPFGMATLF